MSPENQAKAYAESLRDSLVAILRRAQACRLEANQVKLIEIWHARAWRHRPILWSHRRQRRFEHAYKDAIMSICDDWEKCHAAPVLRSQS